MIGKCYCSHGMGKSVSKVSLVPAESRPALASLVEDYLADARASGLAPATIKYGYGFPLHEIFLPWAAASGIDSVEQLTSRVFNQYAIYLEEVGGRKGKLKVASRWTYIKAVKRFLAWAQAEGEPVAGVATLPNLPN